MNLCSHDRLQSNELSYIVMQQTIYPRNNVLTNKQNFDNPRTLSPTNKNDSTVIVVFEINQLNENAFLSIRYIFYSLNSMQHTIK